MGYATGVEQDGRNCRKAFQKVGHTITGGGFFRKVNIMNGNKQEWHLPRDDNIKCTVMEFLENISDLLHHFSFDDPIGDTYLDMRDHSPTLRIAKERCRQMDQVREANRMRKEADLRKEQEAREKSSKEMKVNEDELRELVRKDAKIRETALAAARLFLNDNADNSILHKHCETKITRAVERSERRMLSFTLSSLIS
eukprot:3365395-Amphidinium_carterae.1